MRCEVLPSLPYLGAPLGWKTEYLEIVTPPIPSNHIYDYHPLHADWVIHLGSGSNPYIPYAQLFYVLFWMHWQLATYNLQLTAHHLTVTAVYIWSVQHLSRSGFLGCAYILELLLDQAIGTDGGFPRWPFNHEIRYHSTLAFAVGRTRRSLPHGSHFLPLRA